MITKGDYLIAAGAGFLTGALLLVILGFLKISFPYQTFAALVLIPALWAFGVWLGGFLSKWIQFFAQFGKYSAAGFLSAAIDFAILNYVSYLTGITAGIVIGWVNVPGFLVAVANGYLWNKLWVFKSTTSDVDRALSTSDVNIFSDFPKFFAVTVGGLIINSVLIIVLTTYISPPLSPAVWLNIAKLLANVAVLLWNFTGFKLIVFKK